MIEIEVKNQQELDQALADGKYPTCIGNEYFNVTDSSNVTACGSSSVHRLSSTSKIVGKNIIEKPIINTAKKWCENYGVDILIEDDCEYCILYKGVNSNYFSDYNFKYLPGSLPIAPDWDGGDKECGGGLHFSPVPAMTLKYAPTAKKFMACPIKLTDISVKPNANMPDKIKAKGCCLPIWEVDINGNKIC